MILVRFIENVNIDCKSCFWPDSRLIATKDEPVVHYLRCGFICLWDCKSQCFIDLRSGISLFGINNTEKYEQRISLEFRQLVFVFCKQNGAWSLKKSKRCEGRVRRGGLDLALKNQICFLYPLQQKSSFVQASKKVLFFISRTSKIFKQMSRFIGSRSPSQCRSQNQKVYKRFRTLTRIVAEFKKEIGEQPFREAYAQMA